MTKNTAVSFEPKYLIAGAAVLASAAAAWILYRESVRRAAPLTRPTRRPLRERLDKVDQASLQSFPASDPPSY